MSFLSVALSAWTSLAAQVIEISGARPLSEELGVPGDRTWLAVDGGLARPLSTWYRLPEGRHQLLIVERGADGTPGEARWVNVFVPARAAQSTVPYALHFDTTAPRIRKSSDYGARGEKPPVLILDESGIRSVEYRVGGQPLQDWYLDNPTAAGEIEVTIVVEDGAGNRATDQVRYTIDVQGPAVAWSTSDQPIEGSEFYAAPMNLTLTAEDPSGVDRLEVLGETSTEVKPGSPVVATHSRLRVAALDKLGNRTEQVLDLPIDDRPPQLSLSSGGDRVAAGASIEASASDGETGVASLEYRFDDGRWRAVDGPIEVNRRARSMTVRAVDQAGNETTRELQIDAG